MSNEELRNALFERNITASGSTQAMALRLAQSYAESSEKGQILKKVNKQDMRGLKIQSVDTMFQSSVPTRKRKRDNNELDNVSSIVPQKHFASVSADSPYHIDPRCLRSSSGTCVAPNIVKSLRLDLMLPHNLTISREQSLDRFRKDGTM